MGEGKDWGAGSGWQKEAEEKEREGPREGGRETERDKEKRKKRNPETVKQKWGREKFGGGSGW